MPAVAAAPVSTGHADILTKSPARPSRVREGSGLTIVALLSLICLAFALQVAMILNITGGHFIYTLDDPYIHLALAAHIHDGHYGINSAEFSSPSSSPIWPLLLSLTAATPFQEWVPLALNLLSTLGSACVLITVFGRATSSRLASGLLSAAAVLALNLVGVAFTGMEHSLQVLVSLLAGYGIVVAVEDKRIVRWLPAVLILGPLIRYENVAISASAAIVLFALGHRRLALITTGTWAALLLGFSVLLMSMRLDPLPSSILAKSPYGISESVFSVVAGKIEFALEQPSFLICLVILVIDALLVRRFGPLHWFVIMALMAHAVAGDFGWMDRYQLYVLAAVAPPLAAFVSRWPSRLDGGKVIARVCTVAVVVCFLPIALTTFKSTGASNNIWGQQAQTAEFVRGYWQRPIAVNDLGLVAYRGGQPVLDLWGLANQDARKARAEGQQYWPVSLVEQEHVELVAVYAEWFEGQLSPDWVHVGSLSVEQVVSSAARQVDFYAVDASAASAACSALADFSQHAPPTTKVTVTC